MMDAVLEAYLYDTHRRAMEFAAASDVIRLQAGPGNPPHVYLAHFDAPCYVFGPAGEVGLHQGFTLGISFPPDYLRATLVPAQNLLHFVDPREVWHSNIRWPFICIGHIAPGCDIVEILLRVYELATFQRKASPDEFDALNPDACRWARQHWPVEATTRMPLKFKRAQGGQP